MIPILELIMESTNPKIVELQKKLLELKQSLCNQTIQRGNEITGFFNQLDDFVINVAKIVDGTINADLNPIELFDCIQIRFKLVNVDITNIALWNNSCICFVYYSINIDLEKFGNQIHLKNLLFRKNVNIELLQESNKKQIRLSIMNEPPIQYEKLSPEYYQIIKSVLDQIFNMKDVLYIQLLERVIAWYSSRLK